ncbi:hypothetical protein C482_14634 [Natrialba chahannaoensis JCM 10990]|uniref:Lipoprotein n=1 Tax=Natrialba chahannaoensis JCM 10990 TaxID=1227492 RepID=M0AF56_9EURY|nr:hypothetical protein [Natrialba chahannaoensis]ELY97016.1 hypothetical protein C482_14634 [Natrialba chahannaoensis JCM 10990]
MQRRNILLAAATASVSGIAGCLDELQQDQSQDNTRSQEPEEESSTSEEGDSDDSEGSDNTEDKEQILDWYEDGIGKLNEGTRNLNDAIDSGGNGNHIDTEIEAEDARADYEQAEEYFSNAVSLTYEIDNSDAREVCEDAEERARLYYQSAGFLRRSARRAQDEEFDRAENLWYTAEDRSNEAQRISLQGSDTLASILDLD